MPENAIILAFIMIVALNFYILMGGADYGGGVWDLFASGENKSKQQELIARAIGPIWEANHVWLILVIVVLFSAFPPVYAAISTTLHIPVTLLLLGIVARGTAFTFRTYDSKKDHVQRRWGRIFAISSLLVPIILGIIIGTISSGDFVVGGTSFQEVYLASWCKPFSFAVGFLALSLFSFLAAVYLAAFAESKDLKNEFRVRAITAQSVSACMAAIVFVMAENNALALRQALTQSLLNIELAGFTAICAIACTAALIYRKFYLARNLAALQVTLILWGWALAQYPYLVRPNFTIFNSHGPESTLTLLVIALGAGAFLLLPSLYILFRVFRTTHTESEI